MGLNFLISMALNRQGGVFCLFLHSKVFYIFSHTQCYVLWVRTIEMNPTTSIGKV